MVFNSTYKLVYTVDKKSNELLVSVELKMRDSNSKPYQNIYYGHAIVDGTDYKKIDLSHCVNARHVAEEIGLKLKAELKAKYADEGKSFRIKKEELK